MNIKEEFLKEHPEMGKYDPEGGSFFMIYSAWLEGKIKQDRALLEDAVSIMQSQDVYRNNTIKDFIKRAKEFLGEE